MDCYVDGNPVTTLQEWLAKGVRIPKGYTVESIYDKTSFNRLLISIFVLYFHWD